MLFPVDVKLYIPIAVPSLLLVVDANGVEYAELTTSAIQSGRLDFQNLLNTSQDARIKGLYGVHV